MGIAPKAPFLFGEFDLDVVQRVLRKNGEIAALGARAFDRFAEPFANRDWISSENELLKRVWERQIVEKTI